MKLYLQDQNQFINRVYFSCITGLTWTLADAVIWNVSFMVIHYFWDIQYVIGSAWCYWMLSIVSACGILFVLLLVPRVNSSVNDKGVNGADQPLNPVSPAADSTQNPLIHTSTIN